MSKLKLYSCWFSSCAHRVRIALNLKGLEYEYKAVDILKGEQFDPEYEKLNPVKFVPTLVDGDFVLADSFAIITYLEDKYPQCPLLPSDLKKKALNIQKVINNNFEAIEKLLKECAGKYATGDEIQLADVFLEPQIYIGVTLFQIDMSRFPILSGLHEAYNKLPAFQAALPLRQPDAPSSS